MLVGVQLLVLGLYLPPVFKGYWPFCHSAPDNHLAAGPHCRVKPPASRRVVGAGDCPTIGDGVISTAGIRIAADAISAPDNHFAAGPHCRVIGPGLGRVDCLVGVQLSVLGLYRPPVLNRSWAKLNPPQTIISVPVHTAV